MRYDKDFKPAAWRLALRMHGFYEGAIMHSLHYLSEVFHISNLTDNKRPMDGKEYITVNEDTDTLIIKSLFNKNSDYLIPRASAVNLNDKLREVYNREIAYLKDMFTDVGRYYDSAEFDAFEIIFQNVHNGRISIIAKATSSCIKYPLQIKRVITIETLSRNVDIRSAAHGMFSNIRDKFIEDINRYKAAIKHELNSIYGITGGDFDGDVLYKEYLDKEMSKLQLNSIYGLHGGDIPAKVEFTNRVKGFGASTYKLFGVPESMVDTKESTAAYEHAMDAISSTFDKYRGGFMKDYTSMYGKAIKKVIFNDPATVVMWGDGTKTVVKKHGDVEFNGEAAVMYAYVLRWHFNNNRKSMRIWLKQNAKRFEWQSEEPKKITITRTAKGKITKASQKEIYEAMTPEQKEVVDAMIQDAVKESKKGGKNEDIR